MNLFLGFEVWWLQLPNNAFRCYILSIFKLTFLDNHWFDFVLECLNQTNFTCDWSFDLKFFKYVTFVGFLMDQKYYKVLLVLAKLGIQTHIFFSSSLFSFPSRCQSEAFLSIEKSFLFKEDYSFLNIMEYVSYIRIEILVEQKWKKM